MLSNKNVKPQDEEKEKAIPPRQEVECYFNRVLEKENPQITMAEIRQMYLSHVQDVWGKAVHAWPV